MRNNNLKIYFVISFILLIVISFLIIFLLREDGQPQQAGTEIITPTPVASTRTPEENRRESQPLEGEDFDQLIESVQNRSRLSEQDLSIRNELISQGEGEGADKRDIYSTPAFILRYVPTADVFHAEILGNNIDEARSSLLTYLRSLGLSDEGICNLPVVFYKDPKRDNTELTTGLYFYELLTTCPEN